MALSGPLCLAVFGETLLIGGTFGVAKSTDDGQTWAASDSGLITGSPAPLGDVQKMVVNGSTVFAGASGGGMFYSGDKGTTWKHAVGGVAAGNITALGTAGSKTYAGTQGLGLFVTEDQGLTWTSVALSSAATDNFITAFASAGGNLFVATLGGLNQSHDDGKTWNAIEAGLPTPGYVSAVAANASTLYAGTVKGVWSRALSDFPTALGVPVVARSGGAMHARMSGGKAILGAIVDDAPASGERVFGMDGKSLRPLLPSTR